MTVLQSLKSLSAYPIPAATIQNIAVGIGISPDEEATRDMLNGNGYRHAAARVYIWLSKAPDVSQDGISYRLSAEERKLFRQEAATILKDLGFADSAVGVQFGYQGEDL